MIRTVAGLVAALFLMTMPQIALAMIKGSEGNSKQNDPRMPKGANAIINRQDRIAIWEGDGGPFHADGRGDTKAMNKILADFAKLDVKTKRVIVHDGFGQSFFLNMDRRPELKKAALIDWEFAVWPNGKWEDSLWMLSRPNHPPPEKPDLPAQINVYTANIRWGDVVVPPGIEVIDERLEAHGFTAADGIVIEGRLKKSSDGLPMSATVRIQRIELKQGHYVYTEIANTTSNEQGAWVFKNLPAAWVRIVAEAEGFVPRVIGHAQSYDQPQWYSFESTLVPAVSIAGRVADVSGTPLADVDVRLDDVIIESGHDYRSPTEFKFKTDAEGRFQSNQVPAGKATVWLHKSGFSMNGLGQSITLPTKDIELQLTTAGSIRVTVDFNGKKRPKEYIVELEPEGGEVVGKYGGTASIDANNEVTFENVPPDVYIIKGHPNPSKEREFSKEVKIDLKRGEAAQVTIKAK